MVSQAILVYSFILEINVVRLPSPISIHYVYALVPLWITSSNYVNMSSVQVYKSP